MGVYPQQVRARCVATVRGGGRLRNASYATGITALRRISCGMRCNPHAVSGPQIGRWQTIVDWRVVGGPDGRFVE